jgi:hypothetical protein
MISTRSCSRYPEKLSNESLFELSIPTLVMVVVIIVSSDAWFAFQGPHVGGVQSPIEGVGDL